MYNIGITFSALADLKLEFQIQFIVVTDNFLPLLTSVFECSVVSCLEVLERESNLKLNVYIFQ